MPGIGASFGWLPANLRRRVLAERSIERVDALRDRALEASSVDEFAGAL